MQINKNYWRFYGKKITKIPIWTFIVILSTFDIYISLISLCISSSLSSYAPIGATTLYVKLLLVSHLCTNIRIYKEEEPPLPATRASYSMILIVAMFYFPYYYSTFGVLFYVCSMFAFGFGIFQLNSPMDIKHAGFTLFIGFLSACQGFWLAYCWPDTERSILWVITFAILYAKLMFPINGIYWYYQSLQFLFLFRLRFLLDFQYAIKNIFQC